MAIDFMDGGYEDSGGGDGGFDWDEWLRRERQLNQPDQEPQQFEPVPQDDHRESPVPEPPQVSASQPQQANPDPDPRPNDSGGNNDSGNNNSGGGDNNTPSWFQNNPNDEAPGVNDMIARDQGSWEKRLRESGGNLFDKSDLEGVIRAVSAASNVGQDPDKFLREAEERYKARGGSTSHRPFDSQTTDPAQIAANAAADRGTYVPPRPQPAPSLPFPGSTATPRPSGMPAQGPAWNGPQATSVPGQFSDPITKFLEAFAQRRAQELENPPMGSGQQLLEDYMRRLSAQLENPQAGSGAQLYEDALKRVSGQFENGGFTPAEQEVFTTQAIEPLEQLRKARRDQVLHSLQARGIPPTSGVALQMLSDVDRQFDTLRVGQQRDLASRAANEKTSRMMTALQQLGALSGEQRGRQQEAGAALSGLAGTQNQRLDQAYQYRTVPVNLADRAFNQTSQAFGMNESSAQNAFNRAFQMFNASGNPLTLVQPMMALANTQQGQTDGFQRGMAELIWMLTQGRGAA